MKKFEAYFPNLTACLFHLPAFLYLRVLRQKSAIIYLSLGYALLLTVPATAQQKQYHPIAVNPVNNLLAIPTHDSLMIIDAGSHQKLYQLAWPGQVVKYISFNATGNYLICADEMGKTIVYSVSENGGSKVMELPVKTIAAVFDNTRPRIYIVHSKSWTGAKLSSVEIPGRKMLNTVSVPSGINAIALNANGSILAYTNGQNIVELNTGDLKTVRSHWERSTQHLLAFNPGDIHQCATSTGEQIIQIRSLTTDSIIVEIRAHQKKIEALAYNHDGSMLYSLDESGELNTWSLSNRRRLTRQTGVFQTPYWDTLGKLNLGQLDTHGRFRIDTTKASDSTEQCCFTPVVPMPIELIPQPVITYTPETGLMIGLNATTLINNLSAPAGAPYRSSIYSLSTIYGFGGKQWRNSFSINNYSPGGWHVVAQIQYNRHDKNYYFGIGPAADRKNRQPYVNNNLTFNGSVAYFLSGNWSVGLKYELSNYSTSKFQNKDVVLPFGSSGGFLTGFGPAIQYDSRNDILFPAKGSFMEFNFLKYGLFRTGSYEYDEVQLDYRKYFGVGRDNDATGIALQAFFDAVWNGEVPFYKLPYFTFDRSFRGMWRNLYINRQIATVQAEFHSLFDKTNPRLGYVVFISAADGTATFFKNYRSDIKFAFGGGLRSQLLPKKRIYARIDYSFSNKGDYGILGGIGTAF